jgi:hypothetical protein
MLLIENLTHVYTEWKYNNRNTDNACRILTDYILASSSERTRYMYLLPVLSPAFYRRHNMLF